MIESKHDNSDMSAIRFFALANLYNLIVSATQNHRMTMRIKKTSVKFLLQVKLSIK